MDQHLELGKKDIKLVLMEKQLIKILIIVEDHQVVIGSEFGVKVGMRVRRLRVSRKYLNGRWCARCSKKDPTPYLRKNAKLFPKEGNVLDIGCGNGRNSIFMKSLGYTVDSIDMATDYGSKIILGVDKLPRRRKYDVILANYVLMFLNEKERSQVLNEICEVAKKTSMLMIELYPAKDAHEYSLNAIVKRLEKRGWTKMRKSVDRCILKRGNA